MKKKEAINNVDVDLNLRIGSHTHHEGRRMLPLGESRNAARAEAMEGKQPVLAPRLLRQRSGGHNVSAICGPVSSAPRTINAVSVDWWYGLKEPYRPNSVSPVTCTRKAVVKVTSDSRVANYHTNVAI